MIFLVPSSDAPAARSLAEVLEAEKMTIRKTISDAIFAAKSSDISRSLHPVPEIGDAATIDKASVTYACQKQSDLVPEVRGSAASDDMKTSDAVPEIREAAFVVGTGLTDTSLNSSYLVPESSGLAPTGKA